MPRVSGTMRLRLFNAQTTFRTPGLFAYNHYGGAKYTLEDLVMRPNAMPPDEAPPSNDTPAAHAAEATLESGGLTLGRLRGQ